MSKRRNAAGLPFLPFIGVTPDLSTPLAWRTQVTANYAGLTEGEPVVPESPQDPGFYYFGGFLVVADPSDF